MNDETQTKWEENNNNKTDIRLKFLLYVFCGVWKLDNDIVTTESSKCILLFSSSFSSHKNVLFSVAGCKCTRVHSVHLFLFGFFLLYFQHAHVRAHSNENSLFFLVRPLWVVLKLRVEGKKWFPAFYLNWSKIFSWLKVVFRILTFLCFGGHRFFICYYYCWVFTFLKWIKKCKFMIKYHY